MLVHVHAMLVAHPVQQSALHSPPLPLPSYSPYLLPMSPVAVKLIAEATAKARAGILNLGPQAPPFFPSGQHYVQDKVFIGLDEAPEEFHLHEKLQGPGVGGASGWCRGGASMWGRGSASGWSGVSEKE